MFCSPLSLRLVGVWTPRYLISIGSCPLSYTCKCIEIRDRTILELNQTCMCLLVLWINVLTCGKWQIVDRSGKVWTAQNYSLEHPSSIFRLKATMPCVLLWWFTPFKMSMVLGMWLVVQSLWGSVLGYFVWNETDGICSCIMLFGLDHWILL